MSISSSLRVSRSNKTFPNIYTDDKGLYLLFTNPGTSIILNCPPESPTLIGSCTTVYNALSDNWSLIDPSVEIVLRRF